MSNYTSILKSWGDIGTVYPDGYSHVSGEPPVDGWENFFKYNVISDLDSLINTTNSRIETDKGTSANKPTAPEQSHLYYSTDTNSLEYWDSESSSWNRLFSSDGDTLYGALNFNGKAAENVGPLNMSGTANLNGNDLVDGTTTLYNATTGQFSDADTVDGMEASELGSDVFNNGNLVLSNANFDFGTNLSVTDNGDGTVTVNAAQDADTHTAVSENGTELVSSVDNIDFTGHLNVIDDGDGAVTIDPAHNHDSRYYQPDGNDKLVIETRTSDPTSPVSGQTWIIE
jgi:hypothetical protein